MSVRPLPLVRSNPGDRDWSAYCEWIRTYLYFDRDTGYICFRPRDYGHFLWTDNPQQAAQEWNAGSANRPIRVHRRKKMWAYVRVDGSLTAWHSVRAALGLLDRGFDPNSELPDPESLSDAEIVRVFGIDYAIMRYMLRARDTEREEKAFEAAVARIEKRIERKLSRMEKAVAETVSKKLR